MRVPLSSACHGFVFRGVDKRLWTASCISSFRQRENVPRGPGREPSTLHTAPQLLHVTSEYHTGMSRVLEKDIFVPIHNVARVGKRKVHETGQLCMLSNISHGSSLAGKSINVPLFLTEKKLFKKKNGTSQEPSCAKWGSSFLRSRPSSTCGGEFIEQEA